MINLTSGITNLMSVLTWLFTKVKRKDKGRGTKKVPEDTTDWFCIV